VLSQHIRNLFGCTTENLTVQYLASLSDEPLIPDLTQYRRCDNFKFSDRLGHISIPASTGHTASEQHKSGAVDGHHRVTTIWVPGSITEWVPLKMCGFRQIFYGKYLHWYAIHEKSALLWEVARYRSGANPFFNSILMQTYAAWMQPSMGMSYI